MKNKRKKTRYINPSFLQEDESTFAGFISFASGTRSTWKAYELAKI